FKIPNSSASHSLQDISYQAHSASFQILFPYLRFISLSVNHPHESIVTCILLLAQSVLFQLWLVMAGREVREYTNLTDPKERKLGKGKDKVDDEDVTFHRMVAKGSWLFLLDW
ncbi:hypothetical protein LINPERHAP2_LOCUS34697, partial [Linum perenne]